MGNHSRNSHALPFVAIGVLAAAPCRADGWPIYQHDNHHTARSTASFDPLSLTPAWQAPLGYSVPLLVENTIYAMRTGGGTGTPTRIASFRLCDGHVNWEMPATYTFPSAIAYADGLIVYAAQDSGGQRLFVRDAETGAQRYFVPITDAFVAMPTLNREPSGQLVAYVCSGSRLAAVALNDASGSVSWERTGNYGGQCIPAIVGESVIVASPDHFYAYRRTNGSVNAFQNGGGSGGGGNSVVYDEARGKLYVTESINGTFDALTAYNYVDNATITFAWQRTGTANGIRNAGSVAIAPDGRIYTNSASVIAILDPADGHTLLSRNLSLANGSAPMLSDGYVWVFDSNQTLILDMETLSTVHMIPGSRGSLNTAYKGIGGLGDGNFLLDYGRIVDRPGFQVFRKTCQIDFDNDGAIGLSDLAVLLSGFGSPAGPDLDCDGACGLSDLAVILSAFGSNCP
jgi:hypothetical protein